MKYNGKDIPVITLPPQWEGAGAVRATMAHRTIVAEALDGTEDRRQRRPRPLWHLSYRAVSHTARETGYMRGVLLAAREMPVAVPFWPQAVALTADAAADTLTVQHEAAAGFFQYRPGGYALLLTDALHWETVRIAEPGATETELTAGLAANWPARTYFVPLLIGHMPKPDTAHETDELGVWQIDFEEKFLEVET